jgi:hypothetical protein
VTSNFNNGAVVLASCASVFPGAHVGRLVQYGRANEKLYESAQEQIIRNEVYKGTH